MPTSTIRRVETIVTGVAGSPYYVVGHFTADTGTPTQVTQAWHKFVTGSTSGTASGFPVGTVVQTQPEVQLINPVDGAVIGLEDAPPITQNGANPGPQLPRQNQLLVRWRTGNYVNRREVRGRTNLPCVLEEASTNQGEVESTVVSGINTRASELIADTNSVLVVWSKKNGLWWAAATGSCWNKFSVLRSRRD